MCYNLKSIKAMKKNIPSTYRSIFSGAYVDLTFLNICGKFLGKVTREKQVRRKKNHLLSVN